MSTVTGAGVIVVGAGIMGAGIAQVAAQAGYRVAVVDSSPAALASAPARIQGSLRRLVRAGRLDNDGARSTATRLRYLDVVAEAADDQTWLVIEAVVEDLDVKQRLFAELDTLLDDRVLLATNTSQFPIGQVALRCKSKGRVIGMHWSNPPPIMRLVEVILADETAPDALDRALAFLNTCGKESVVCRRDVPGFVSNRLSTVLFMEAVRLVEQGVATAADIDQVAIKMFGHTMGPLATLDLAGIDTALRVSTALDEHYGGDRFAPPVLLQQLVQQGHFGRKSGRGFYEYDEDAKP